MMRHSETWWTLLCRVLMALYLLMAKQELGKHSQCKVFIIVYCTNVAEVYVSVLVNTLQVIAGTKSLNEQVLELIPQRDLFIFFFFFFFFFYFYKFLLEQKIQQ